MKGSSLWKAIYVFCAMAGVLTGYECDRLLDSQKDRAETKDNTLIREIDDSVFFSNNYAEPEDTEKTEIEKETGILVAGRQEQPEGEEHSFSDTQPLLPDLSPTVMPTVIPAEMPTEVPAVIPTEITAVPELLSCEINQGDNMIPVPTPEVTPPSIESDDTLLAEVFTYPVRIFGQVPVINRSDAYVSYFEFSYDLIAMLEPEVESRGMNMNSLLTRFAIKAFLCGVDIEKIDITAPIPRRLAALCLWLSAQLLDKDGCNTSAKSVKAYVTDINGCSSSEKKAVAYLYEQGIMKGYGTAGQEFYPDDGLKTEDGTALLNRVSQCWK